MKRLEMATQTAPERTYIKRWELYVVVTYAFVVIAAAAAAIGVAAGEWAISVPAPVGAALGFFGIWLLLIPIYAILARTYYGREVSVARSALAGVVGAAIAAGVGSLFTFL